MRNAGGYGVMTFDCGQVKEEDTFTCNHCNYVTRLKVGERPADVGAFCTSCSKHVCAKCRSRGVAGDTCMPLDKWQEMIEDKYQKSLNRREI